MLIDDLMPEFEFREQHQIEVLAPTERVFSGIHAFDMCESRFVRLLLRLRGLPAKGLTLSKMEESNFQVLGETANEEVLIGLAGKFWTPTGHLQRVNADNFSEFRKPGFAKAAWNFSLEAIDRNATRLMTETRIKTFDSGSRWRFSVYWTFIGPFSGLIRKEMLRIIKEDAESGKSAEQKTENRPG